MELSRFHVASNPSMELSGVLPWMKSAMVWSSTPDLTEEGQNQAVSLLSAFFSVIFHLDLELEKSRHSQKAAGSTHGVYSQLSWPPRDSSWTPMGTRRKSL